jgi:hypothetical protein
MKQSSALLRRLTVVPVTMAGPPARWRSMSNRCEKSSTD